MIVLTDADIQTYNADTSPKMVLFYADWCGHCQALKPDWDAFAANLPHVYSVPQENLPKITGYNTANGFPTIVFLNGDKVEDYKGERNVESLTAFYNKMMGQAGGRRRKTSRKHHRKSSRKHNRKTSRKHRKRSSKVRRHTRHMRGGGCGCRAFN
jgi:thiol-disulfide isomerase/thioredoxin